MRSWTVGLLALGLGACAPSIQVEVLQPAMVTMPGEVRTLAIVDRSAPKNVGQQVLGALEGAATGEAVLGDREGAHRAVETVISTVSASPRFEAVVPAVTKDEAESDLFAKQLSWKAAERICRKSGAQALVALEAFDSDSALTLSTKVETTTEDGKEVSRTVHVAQRDTSILTAWRVYDVESHTILDDVRDYRYSNSWTGEGATVEIATRALPAQYDTILAVAESAGLDYGRRIAPSYVWVGRSYYGKGHDRLKEAKNHVKANDWDGAGQIWTQMVKNQTDPKIRGRAEFDLALYYEVNGQLEDALASAKKAAIDLHNARSRSYVSVLSQRLADQRTLDAQMAAPEPPEEPALAVPEDDQPRERPTQGAPPERPRQ